MMPTRVTTNAIIKQFIAVPSESDLSVPGAITGVEISSLEKIIWIWTHLEDGRSAVTGYEIQIGVKDED